MIEIVTQTSITDNEIKTDSRTSKPFRQHF